MKSRVKDFTNLGKLTKIPQVQNTAHNIRVNYSYYKGVPSPITNGGLNEYGVAVRDIWSPSRKELIDMTPKNQTGPNGAFKSAGTPFILNKGSHSTCWGGFDDLFDIIRC